MTAPTIERQRAAVRRAVDKQPTRQEYAAFVARQRFPNLAQLVDAAALYRPRPRWAGNEGPVWRLGIAAGAISLNRRNYARLERSAERRRALREKEAQLAAAWLLDPDYGYFPGENSLPTREVREFSRKSRANMTQALCQLDYTVLFENNTKPAMVTLTYPGDWLTVAPTGHALRRHLNTFRRRFERSWRRKLVAIWKKEFQGRGAPHVHMLMCPPRGNARRGRYAGMSFKEWLSHTWADIVDHPNPVERAKHLAAGTGVDYREGLRAYDPKRLAVYFTKHGLYAAKEYQHIVPDEWQGPGDGPGRFWGYWNLRRRVVYVELDERAAITAGRMLRRWARAQGAPRTSRGDVATWPAEWKGRYENGHARQHRPGCETWRCTCDTWRTPHAPAVTRAAARTPGGVLVPRDWEVTGLAGAQEYLAQPPSRWKAVRRRVRRLGAGAGWVSVNDGAAFARALAQALGGVWLAHPPSEPPPAMTPADSGASPNGATTEPRCAACDQPLAEILAEFGTHMLCTVRNGLRAQDMALGHELAI